MLFIWIHVNWYVFCFRSSLYYSRIYNIQCAPLDETKSAVVAEVGGGKKKEEKEQIDWAATQGSCLWINHAVIRNKCVTEATTKLILCWRRKGFFFLLPLQTVGLCIYKVYLHFISFCISNGMPRNCIRISFCESIKIIIYNC